jgi:hypothetical protein
MNSLNLTSAIILVLLLGLSAVVEAHPLPAGDKEHIATIRGGNNGTQECRIYRITVDGKRYLVNTCGGIVAE